MSGLQLERRSAAAVAAVPLVLETFLPCGPQSSAAVVASAAAVVVFASVGTVLAKRKLVLQDLVRAPDLLAVLAWHVVDTAAAALDVTDAQALICEAL